jgi:hypothetical protein
MRKEGDRETGKLNAESRSSNRKRQNESINNERKGSDRCDGASKRV